MSEIVLITGKNGERTNIVTLGVVSAVTVRPVALRALRIPAQGSSGTMTVASWLRQRGGSKTRLMM